jgi:predicted metal-binding protein
MVCGGAEQPRGESFMARIAIVSCDAVKNDLGCGAASCFRSFNEKTASFAAYKDEPETLLVGFSTCGKCPTRVAHERILRMIKPLVECNRADTIHFTSCMVKSCPFIKKYEDVIHKAYPEVKLVLGTDELPGPLEATRTDTYRNLLIENSHGITEEVNRIVAEARKLQQQ